MRQKVGEHHNPAEHLFGESIENVARFWFFHGRIILFSPCKASKGKPYAVGEQDLLLAAKVGNRPPGGCVGDSRLEAFDASSAEYRTMNVSGQLSTTLNGEKPQKHGSFSILRYSTSAFVQLNCSQY